MNRDPGLLVRMAAALAAVLTFDALLSVSIAALLWPWLSPAGDALAAATGAPSTLARGAVVAVPAAFGLLLAQVAYTRSRLLADVDADPASAVRPDLDGRARRLAAQIDMDPPEVAVARTDVPNSFAVGGVGDAVVVVSEGLLERLDDDQVDAVLAHELAHIRNRDVVVMVMGQAIASLVGIAVQIAVLTRGRRGGFFAAIIAGQLAQMLVMVFVFAISRYREYVADADAATAIGRGDPLARALEKIGQGHETGGGRGGHGRRGRGRGRGSGSDGVEDRVGALCIFNQERGLLQRAFSTHPPTEKRIERLRSGPA